MLIYLQMEPKWSQNRIKSIKSILTHPDHETSIFQHSGPTVEGLTTNSPTDRQTEDGQMVGRTYRQTNRGMGGK